MLNQGRRRSHRLEPTTFDEVVNVRGRVHGGTCDDREVGNWVIARRDGYKEGAGIWRGALERTGAGRKQAEGQR